MESALVKRLLVCFLSLIGVYWLIVVVGIVYENGPITRRLTLIRIRDQIPDYKYFLGISEEYDKYQRKYERNPTRNGGYTVHKLDKISANWPCFRGIFPIGTEGSITDGHKWACGVHDINPDPIVYSFGSGNSNDFELGFLKLRPTSKIFVFEIDERKLAQPANVTSSISYFHLGLGYHPKYPILKTLKQIMLQLNHTYIDVLKMDIEGHEFPFIDYEKSMFKHVGQYLVELHDFGKKHINVMQYVEDIEASDLRIFHREHNVDSGKGCCSELAFIQRDWEKWEEGKFNLTLTK